MCVHHHFFFFLSSSCFGSHMGWILEGSFEFISVCHQHRLSCFFIFFYRLRFLCPPWPRLHSISPPPSSRYRPLIDAKMSADGIEMSLWITLRIARKMLIDCILQDPRVPSTSTETASTGSQVLK